MVIITTILTTNLTHTNRIMKNIFLLSILLFVSLVSFGQSYSKDLEKQAKNGDIESQYQVGLCYKSGNGIEKNNKKAIKWLKSAANNGHSAACYELAGLLTEKEEQKDWLMKAASSGSDDMKMTVALQLYELNYNREAHELFTQMMKWDFSKREEATERWIKVCKNDHVMLSWMLDWIERDTETDYRSKVYICDKMMKNSQEYYAVPALEELAEKGDAAVKLAVGKVFASRNAAHYQAKGKDYITAAAKLGNMEAIFLRGKDDYESGDKLVGKTRLSHAANNGYQPARELLEKIEQEEEKAKREEEEARIRAEQEDQKRQEELSAVLQSHWKCSKDISFAGEISGTQEGDAAWSLWGIDHTFFKGAVGLSLRNDGSALLVADAIPSRKALEQGQGRVVQVGAFCRTEFTKKIEGQWQIVGDEILITDIPKDWKLTISKDNQTVVCSMRGMLIAKMKVNSKK